MTCTECKGRGFITVGAVMVEDPQHVLCPACGIPDDELLDRIEALEEALREAIRIATDLNANMGDEEAENETRAELAALAALVTK